MRDNLGWSEASEIERILIEQVCLNWLRLNLLQRGSGNVLSARRARARIYAQTFRRKNKLPSPFRSRVRIFSRQRKRQIHFPKPAP